MYIGGTTADRRAEWVAALDMVAALNPAAVVTGHKDRAQGNPPTVLDEPVATSKATESHARQP
ncbi:MAG TPA: hypothetical protein VGH96_09215 [Streptosporangiaceae bacterium]